MESLLFWLFALLTLAGGVGVVAFRNPINGAMSLVGSFFALSGLYLLLEAQLVAALQILVYAGAIMVLFLFVIMLLNLGPRDLGARRFGVGKVAGFFSATAAVVLLLKVVVPLAPPTQSVTSDFGTVAGVGRILYTQYALPFEVVSLLLLTAMVAAVVVAKGKI